MQSIGLLSAPGKEERARRLCRVGSVSKEWQAVTSVMAAGGSRARADYDYLIKLLLIGDSGMHYVPWFYEGNGVPIIACSLLLVFFSVASTVAQTTFWCSCCCMGAWSEWFFRNSSVGDDILLEVCIHTSVPPKDSFQLLYRSIWFLMPHFQFPTPREGFWPQGRCCFKMFHALPNY